MAGRLPRPSTMTMGDLAWGHKTSNWYEITAIHSGADTFSSKVIALGANNHRHDYSVGKRFDYDSWNTNKDLWKEVYGPTFGDLRLNDILLGTHSGNIYQVTFLDSHRKTFVGKVIARSRDPRGTELPIGQSTDERKFECGNYRLFHRADGPAIPPSTEDQSTTTTTQENPVNTENINKAINDLVAEDTAKEVRPIYRAIAKLVGSVRQGEALVVINRHDETYPVRDFLGRMNGKGNWRNSNGESLTTEQVVAHLTELKASSKHMRITRLTPKSGK